MTQLMPRALGSDPLVRIAPTGSTAALKAHHAWHILRSVTNLLP
jgi:hypothetical protein